MSIEVLTVEQLATMSAADILAHAKAVSDYQAQIATAVLTAKSKQTEEAREALQKSLRETLSFPTLKEGTLADIRAAGASGFVVVYDLTTGAGTPSATYPTAAARAKAAKPATGTVAVSAGPAMRAEPRELKAMYDAACPEGSVERIEDDTNFDARLARAVSKRSYPKVDGDGNIVPGADGLPETDVPLASNKLRWALMNARLANIERKTAKVAGA